MDIVRAAACAKSSTGINFEGIDWRQLRSRAAQIAVVAGLARELPSQHSKSSTNFINRMLNDAKGCVRSSILKELLRIVKSSGADRFHIPGRVSHSQLRLTGITTGNRWCVWRPVKPGFGSEFWLCDFWECIWDQRL
eukprot:226538_1